MQGRDQEYLRLKILTYMLPILQIDLKSPTPSAMNRITLADIPLVRRHVMRSKILQRTISLYIALMLAGCDAAEKKPAAEGQSYAGWYLEHAGQGMFQPCGQPQQWRVTTSADLPSRARAFGLDQDTPVYVRLAGTAHGNEIAVSRVEQFGSPTPVLNCGITGVVIPAEAPVSK